MLIVNARYSSSLIKYLGALNTGEVNLLISNDKTLLVVQKIDFF